MRERLRMPKDVDSPSNPVLMPFCCISIGPTAMLENQVKSIVFLDGAGNLERKERVSEILRRVVKWKMKDHVINRDSRIPR